MVLLYVYATCTSFLIVRKKQKKIGRRLFGGIVSPTSKLAEIDFVIYAHTRHNKLCASTAQINVARTAIDRNFWEARPWTWTSAREKSAAKTRSRSAGITASFR